MKLSCLQENLNKGLGIVGRAVATRSTLPITQNILVSAEQSRLKLAATNLEMAITCWVGAKVKQKGDITVPARLLTDFVNSLPNDLIEINLPANGRILELKSGHFQAHIHGIDATDFPPIPQINDGLTTSIEAASLREGIAQVAFAAATEESRPVLTGINTEFDGEQLNLVAADGFRLAVHKTTLTSPVKEKTTVIIPARTLNELNRLLSEQEEPVEITVNEKKSQVLFRLKDAEIVSQLIQGSFPNYSQVIPQSYTTRAVVDIGEFLRVTKMSSIFARDASGIVRLVITPGSELNPGKVTVSAQAEEVGDNVGEVDALTDGEEAKIAFNVKYLSDVLSVLSQAQVALELTTPSSPGTIRPIGVDNYVHVVMPMFVQW
ncbi:MAG TPA: DNA polymerase III subunit beta [Dehalococcoidia bacterium]|nr:DNA polymerase III subunit beta [Dehalococcoidia bacterium]